MGEEGGRLEDLIKNEQDPDLKIHRKLMDAYGKHPVVLTYCNYVMLDQM